MNATGEETITVAAKAHRETLRIVDQAFELMDSARKHASHLAQCVKRPCLDCENGRRVQKDFFRRLDADLRAIVDLITGAPVAQIRGGEPGGPDEPDRYTRSVHGLQRRAPVSVMNSSPAILESLVNVDGEWRAIGDLDAEDCGVLIRRCHQLESAARAAGGAFAEMRERLRSRNAIHVREVFEEGELKDLFQLAGPLDLLKKGTA